MLEHPALIILTLIVIEAAVLWASGTVLYKKYFSFFPAVFWIYFLPMCAVSLGLIHADSPVYARITSMVLPASLILLLMCVDVPAVIGLGPAALGMFLIGSLGIMTGTVAVFALVKGAVGPQFWSGFGALSGSWTGGSANMIAVKEALSAPEDVFMPMVVVDTVVPYVWMGGLVAMVGWQVAFDRWNRARTDLVQGFGGNGPRGACSDVVSETRWRARPLVFMAVIAVLGSLIARRAAGILPEIPGVISAAGWSIIVVSSLGIVLSLTPCRRLEGYGADRIGMWLLYFVLTSIGAKARLAGLESSLVLIAAGFGIVAVHGIFILVGARVLRAPLFLAVTASQANIGGIASAPIVAACYQPGLAPVGLLLAVLGNMIGTYAGIITGQLCHGIAG